MSSSLESTPPGPLSPESQSRTVRNGARSSQDEQNQQCRRSRKGSKTIEVAPYTTFYASTPANRLHRHAVMSLLLKTSEGRERTLRFLQNTLRLYVFFKTGNPNRGASRTPGGAPPKTTRLLLIVFLISAFRKLRNICELLAPLTPTSAHARMRAFAGSADLVATPSASYSSWKTTTSSSSSFASRTSSSPYSFALDNVSSSRWLWTEKHAWAGVDPKDEGVRAAMPPVSDEQSMLLRQRLEGLEVTLSLLDTVSDGVALFARLGVTLTLPLQVLLQRLRKRARGLQDHLPSSGRAYSRNIFHKLFSRAETLADLFWLSTTLVALLQSEWERKEVWKYGRRVRRLMREEELERDRAERELELSYHERSVTNLGKCHDDSTSYEYSGAQEGLDDDAMDEQRLLENERRIQRIREQRRTLRDLRGRLTWLWWDRLRLGADGVFALYDLFQWRLGSEAVRAVAGAISAGVGFSQIWSESSRHSKLLSKHRHTSL